MSFRSVTSRSRSLRPLLLPLLLGAALALPPALAQQASASAAQWK